MLYMLFENAPHRIRAILKAVGHCRRDASDSLQFTCVLEFKSETFSGNFVEAGRLQKDG